MKMFNTIKLFSLSMVLILSGCIVRSYEVTKDRLDQDLSIGNRGYVAGEAPDAGERDITRKEKVVEIEMHPFIKFEKAPATVQSGQRRVSEPLIKEEDDSTSMGNRGYITRSEPLEIAESSAISAVSMEKYTVKKGDTLQKISKQLYGTSKNWTKIYEVNKSRLKAADKIYPGQVLDIPRQELKEPVENLK